MTADRYAGWEIVVPAEFEGLAREHAFRKAWYEDCASNDLKYRFSGPQLLTPKAR
jgi:hypothetical protein